MRESLAILGTTTGRRFGVALLLVANRFENHKKARDFLQEIQITTYAVVT